MKETFLALLVICSVEILPNNHLVGCLESIKSQESLDIAINETNRGAPKENVKNKAMETSTTVEMTNNGKILYRPCRVPYGFARYDKSVKKSSLIDAIFVFTIWSGSIEMSKAVNALKDTLLDSMYQNLKISPSHECKSSPALCETFWCKL